MKPALDAITETLAMYALYIALALAALTYGVPKVTQVLQEHLVNAVNVK